MVKYLDADERKRSRRLWEEAFPEDSKSFDDYYFLEKLKDNRILAIEEDGEIQSMVQMNPYQLQVRENRWNVDYLVGVATRQEKRHQGYMRRLLLRMMKDMRAEKMPFCFLMPADEAIYRPFGFTYIFRQPQWELKSGMELTRKHLMLGEPGDCESGAAWMNRWLSERYQVYTVRNEEYLNRLLKEIASENGTMDALYNGEKMVGMQSFWGLGEPEQRLLYADAPFVREASAAKPAIMARIISPEKFVRVIRRRRTAEAGELLIRLWLEDPLIAENQGSWLWYLDDETSRLMRCEDATVENECRAEQENVLKLTIEELTAWLFGYQVPEAAKPWTPLLETLETVFLDEIV